VSQIAIDCIQDSFATKWKIETQAPPNSLVDYSIITKEAEIEWIGHLLKLNGNTEDEVRDELKQIMLNIFAEYNVLRIRRMIQLYWKSVSKDSEDYKLKCGHDGFNKDEATEEIKGRLSNPHLKYIMEQYGPEIINTAVIGGSFDNQFMNAMRISAEDDYNSLIRISYRDSFVDLILKRKSKLSSSESQRKTIRDYLDSFMTRCGFRKGKKK